MAALTSAVTWSTGRGGVRGAMPRPNGVLFALNPSPTNVFELDERFRDPTSEGA